MLKELMHKLVTDLGLEYHTVVKEVKENLLFQVEPELTLSFTELKPGVFFKSQAGELPKERKEEFFAHVMHANVLGQGTGGAALGMSDDEKFLTLSLIIDYEIDQRDFKESVEEFVNFTHYWRGELERFKKESESSVVS